jgi:hypothetical protein
MRLRPEYRDRDDTELAVLDALADRHEGGMTLFELRSSLGVDIDELETALTGLQHSGLVSVAEDGQRTVFVVDQAAIEPEQGQTEDVGVLEWLRGQFGL